MGLMESTRIVVRKEDEEARDYYRKLERLSKETFDRELEQELDWVENRILAGEKIKEEMKKAGLEGILVKEILLGKGENGVILDCYMILPKVNVLVAYGETEEALKRSAKQMEALKQEKLRKASWLRKMSLNLYFQNFFKPLVIVEGEDRKDSVVPMTGIGQLANKLKEIDESSVAKRLSMKELEKEAEKIMKVHQNMEGYYQGRFEDLMRRMKRGR